MSTQQLMDCTCPSLANVAQGDRIVITNEAQYSSTASRKPLANIEARPGERTKLEQLELDAVRSKADDLRVELSEFDGR